MIKIEVMDRIVDIVNKIEDSNDDEIVLDFPFGHPVLHNHLSLKIIKNKSGNKPITIVTSDLVSRRIGTKLGIKYSILKDSKKLLEEEQNLLKHNYTFFEYMIYELKKLYRFFLSIFSSKKDNYSYTQPGEKVKKSGILLLIAGLLTSVGMLIFIFYFAVSKTYIFITPEIKVRIKAKNLIYKEISQEKLKGYNELYVPLKKVSIKIKLEDVFRVTQIDIENSKRSIGKVKFINEMKQKQVLRPSTRLLSKEGLLFETFDWVSIPPATRDGSGNTIFGVTEVSVRAKFYDDKGNFIGSRGNIKKSTNFILPGLKFNRDKIYAISKGPFIGGDDNLSYIIGKDDIENSKGILEQKLIKSALEKLKTRIKEDNITNTSNYEILGVKNILKYSGLKIKNVSNVKIGDKLEKFKLFGEINLETYVYDKDYVKTILKNLVMDSLLKGTEKLMFIDENSLRISNVISRNSSSNNIKATTEIEIGIAYDFDNNSNHLVKKLKNLVLGLDIKEATKILLNDTKISSVKIKTIPFFLEKVSNIPENIILKIKD